MKQYPQTAAGDTDRLKDEIRLLKLEIAALKNSHSKLAMRVFGDTPELEAFLGEIAAYIVEKYPADLK